MSHADDEAAERHPGLTGHGRAMLRFLAEHPHAPVFRNQAGHRLLPAEVEAIRAAEQQLLAATLDWGPGEPPAWLAAFVADCLRRVPAYRQYGAPPADLAHLPTTSRADLAADIARFVPDDLPIDRLINFRTTGTTGHPLLVASHPTVAARYAGYHKRALRRFGVELHHGRGRVGLALIGMQATCFTYASVNPLMDESGFVKLNLHPADWRDPADRGRYLAALDAELISGDPVSFDALLETAPDLRPRALLSTSMHLAPAMRRRLETAYRCPVCDVYSMNEAGPIAVFDERAGGHVLLQPRLYVEVLDAAGRPIPEGGRGEITLTGGFNEWLPLLRYRTGDHAALVARGPDRVLVGLEGRAPVRYRSAAGGWLNNIDITHALRRFPLVQFRMHQAADGAVKLEYRGSRGDAGPIRAALVAVLGDGARIDVACVDGWPGKVAQYTSDLSDPGGHPDAPPGRARAAPDEAP